MIPIACGLELQFLRMKTVLAAGLVDEIILFPSAVEMFIEQARQGQALSHSFTDRWAGGPSSAWSPALSTSGSMPHLPAQTSNACNRQGGPGPSQQVGTPSGFLCVWLQPDFPSHRFRPQVRNPQTVTHDCQGVQSLSHHP